MLLISDVEIFGGAYAVDDALTSLVVLSILQTFFISFFVASDQIFSYLSFLLVALLEYS